MTETLVLDFVVRRTVHLLATGNHPTTHLQAEFVKIEGSALRGAANPLMAGGASLVLESAFRLKALMAQSGKADDIPKELENLISACQGSVLAYNFLFQRGVSAGIANMCGFSPVRLSGSTGQE